MISILLAIAATTAAAAPSERPLTAPGPTRAVVGYPA